MLEAGQSRRAAILLLVVGLMQMAGEMLGLPTLRDLGAATAASPVPRVLAAVDGFETYSSKFFLECTRTVAGASPIAQLRPGTFGRLRGPGSRRNVFGAVLGSGPVLAGNAATLPMFLAASGAVLCAGSPFLEELRIQVPTTCGSLRLRVAPREGAVSDLPLVLEPLCR